MVQELTLVWLSAANLQLYQADLNSWSRTQHLELRGPSETPTASYDPAVAEAIELHLENGRTAVAAGQDGTQALAEASRQILAHPDLPQAAWLMAEYHRLSALLLLSNANAVQAAEQHRAADALEGSRAASYSAASVPVTPLNPDAVVEIEALGTRDSDQIFIDGERVERPTLTTVGAHHVRVIRDQYPVWSGWLQVAAQGGKLMIPLDVLPCSAADLSQIAIEGLQVMTASDVRCQNWVVARPYTIGKGIELWQCQRNRCVGPQRWSTPSARPAKQAEEDSSSAWYVWPLVGVGLTLGTAAVLWQTGAFDSDEPPQRLVTTFSGPEGSAALLRF